jgi:cytochrome c oxidase cbb3-type subunit 3
MPPNRILLLGAALAFALACGDDTSQLVPATASPTEEAPLRTSTLSAGTALPDLAMRNPYATDPLGAVAGRDLYGAMNCAGCHGPAGGGGIGPPLADTEWIYGGQPENIVQSILVGRPNGMPAFGPRLPAPDAWKLAAYVHTLSADARAADPADAATSGRGSRAPAR